MQKFEKHKEIKHGKVEIIKEGKDISILAIGKTVERAVEVAKMLEKESVNAEVINVRFLKPFDIKAVKKSIRKTKKVITIEDGTIINGLATTVKELIDDEKLGKIGMQTYAYPDEFIKHGTVEELEKLYHQDAKFIYNEAIKIIDKKQQKDETLKTCP